MFKQFKKFISKFIFFQKGSTRGQHGPVRLPSLREEGEEQPANHVRVRQRIQARGRTARSNLY